MQHDLHSQDTGTLLNKRDQMLYGLAWWIHAYVGKYILDADVHSTSNDTAVDAIQPDGKLNMLMINSLIIKIKQRKVTAIGAHAYAYDNSRQL